MAEIKLKDATGKGYGAAVGDNNRLKTDAVTKSEQHFAAARDNLTFQCSHVASIAASEVNLMLIKNTSDTRDAVITFLRVQATIEATASSGDYFKVSVGGSYSSGGTTLTAINTYVGSAVTADGEFFGHTAGSAIVTSGTYEEIDRSYDNKDMTVYNKAGSVIIPKNQSMLISYVGSTAAGSAWCRAAFYYDKGENGN